MFAPNTVQVEIEFNGTPELIVPRLLKCHVQLDTHQRMPTNVSIFNLIYIDCNQFADSNNHTNNCNMVHVHMPINITCTNEKEQQVNTVVLFSRKIFSTKHETYEQKILMLTDTVKMFLNQTFISKSAKSDNYICTLKVYAKVEVFFQFRRMEKCLLK